MPFTCRLCGVDGDEKSNFIYLFDKIQRAKDNLDFINTQLQIRVTSEDKITQHICYDCSITNNHYLSYFKKCQDTQLVLNERLRQANTIASLHIENVNVKEETLSRQKINPEIQIFDLSDDSDESDNVFNNAANLSQIDINTSRVPTIDNVPAPIATQKKPITGPLNSDARVSVAFQDTGNIIKGKPQPRKETEMEHHNRHENFYHSDNNGNESITEPLNSNVRIMYQSDDSDEFDMFNNAANFCQIDINTSQVPIIDNVPASIATQKKPITLPLNTIARASVIVRGKAQPRKETEIECHNRNDNFYPFDNNRNESITEPLNSNIPVEVFDIESDYEEEECESDSEYVPSPKKKCFKCPNCKANMQDRNALSNHYRLNHKDRALCCSQCDFVTLDNDMFKQHVEGVHHKYFMCKICHTQFGKQANLTAHIRRMHEDGEPIDCNFCDMTFKQKYESQKHKNSVHFVDDHWVCYICKEQFSGAKLLVLHMMEIHNDNKRIECPVDNCMFSAQHKYFMGLHNKEVHEKKNQCLICKKKFKGIRWLQHHTKMKLCNST